MGNELPEIEQMGRDEKKLAIRNIGMILSGKIEQPVLDGDWVVAVGGIGLEE